MGKFIPKIVSATALLLSGACSQRTGEGCCDGRAGSSAAPGLAAPAATARKQQNPTTPAEVAYTCSMHPEIVSRSPGKCPKCGMDLIRKT